MGKLDKKSEVYMRREVAQLEQHAAEINARIIPEEEGIVRTSGPRRQCMAEVIDGILHLI